MVKVVHYTVRVTTNRMKLPQQHSSTDSTLSSLRDSATGATIKHSSGRARAQLMAQRISKHNINPNMLLVLLDNTIVVFFSSAIAQHYFCFFKYYGSIYSHFKEQNVSQVIKYP